MMDFKNSISVLIIVFSSFFLNSEAIAGMIRGSINLGNSFSSDIEGE